MKILVVDDEYLVRWFFERTLGNSGHEVITAEDVADASVKLASKAIDVLIVDLRLPNQPGTELIGKVDIMGKKPKVIVCSAFITSALEEEFRQKGICILRKPFNVADLNDAVQI